jgi:hypothetical protein
MFYLRFHLPVLLSSYSFITSNINYNSIRLYSICLMFLSQIISSSSSSPISNDRALIIAISIKEYICQNHVLTCFFRKRHHQFDNEQELDNCKSFLILHSCLHYDTDTTRMCYPSTLSRAKLNLDNETPRHCFTSSVYKTFYAQHLRSITPSRTIVKCQIFVLFSLLISFVIKIRVCCWHYVFVNVKACAIALLKIFGWRK